MWKRFVLLIVCASISAKELTRKQKVLSIFSVVQFPNEVCTTSSSSTVYGTCLTASECTANGGVASGDCAASFGVCCLVTESTCSTTISQNNTYITNIGYPSVYTPSTTGSCVFTINKCSDDICQLRFDFHTFTGFSVASTGACTDSFAVTTSSTGKSPPSICGTNTGYHMYAEIGANSGDTATVTLTYGGTSDKKFNIFVRQIECSSPLRAPTDCVQYYTASSGTIRSYNWAGGQLLRGMDYEICIRDEEGSCSISYKESTGTTIDAFAIFNPAASTASTAESTSGACILTGGAGLIIPAVSSNGIIPINPSFAVEGFPSQFCGDVFGLDGATTSGITLTSARKPFSMHLFTKPDATLTPPTSTGFSIDYSQNSC